jgi:hypothetical protein
LASAAAFAIAFAPIAAAAPASSQSAPGATSSSTDAGTGAEQSCIGLGTTQSQCQSPGNAQINDSLPQVDYFPYAGGAT